MLKTTKLVVPAALVMCVLASFMLALGARQTAPPATIAVIDLEKVFAGLEEKAARAKDLEALQVEAQAKLTAMQETLKKLASDIGLMPAGPDRKAKVLQHARLMIEGKNEKDFSNDVLALEEGEVFRELFNKVDAAVEEIAKKRGFNIVLMSDEKLTIPPNSTKDGIERLAAVKKLLYVDPALDITAEVITYMNNQYKANVSAPGTPAPAAAPAPAAKKTP